jgi:hypothetical protein
VSPRTVASSRRGLELVEPVGGRGASGAAQARGVRGKVNPINNRKSTVNPKKSRGGVFSKKEGRGLRGKRAGATARCVCTGALTPKLTRGRSARTRRGRDARAFRVFVLLCFVLRQTASGIQGLFRIYTTADQFILALTSPRSSSARFVKYDTAECVQIVDLSSPNLGEPP